MTHSVRSRRFAAFVAFAALWICAIAHAAQVRAWLDRSSMQLGETVTLNVEVSDDASAAQPDFSALRQDFNLLGTQSSSSMNIINGQTTSKLIWAVGLAPRAHRHVQHPRAQRRRHADPAAAAHRVARQHQLGQGRRRCISRRQRAAADALRAAAGTRDGETVLCVEPDRRQSRRPARGRAHRAQARSGQRLHRRCRRAPVSRARTPLRAHAGKERRVDDGAHRVSRPCSQSRRPQQFFQPWSQRVGAGCRR